ncbi:MAG: hypothetical protein JWN67_3454 [Actinomycetia bacterium]|nr:hypothetical protein [Actinomycetes bacterium]
MLIASRNRELRERLVDAARAHPLVHLVGTLRDISDARTGGPYPDVVVVGGGEPSRVGVNAVTLARELFPGVLLVPVTEDDEPDRIVDFAQRTASETLPR